MYILDYISDCLIPFIIVGIISFGIVRGIPVYQTFVRGARSGLKTVAGILPTLIGLMTAVGILRSSGFLDFISRLAGQFTDLIGFPGELVPLAIVKMFSSSAASGLLLDIFRKFGPDSRIGISASLALCCTETIFYTMSVYFMTAKIRRSRYTLAGALLASAAGLAASVFLAGAGSGL